MLQLDSYENDKKNFCIFYVFNNKWNSFYLKKMLWSMQRQVVREILNFKTYLRGGGTQVVQKFVHYS